MYQFHVSDKEWAFADAFFKAEKTATKFRRKRADDNEYQHGKHSFIKFPDGEVLVFSNQDSKRIGEGGEGKIILAKDREGNYWAVKVEEGKTVQKKEERTAVQEAEAVAEMCGYADNRMVRVASDQEKPLTLYLKSRGRFQVARKLYTKMPLVEGESIYAQLQNDNTKLHVKNKFYMLRILAALHRLHRLGIIHRDLNPNNIMVLNRGNGETGIDIIDFTSAVLLQDGAEVKHGDAKGSLMYSSKEVFTAGTVPYTIKSDVFSIGMIFILDFACLGQQVAEFLLDKFSKNKMYLFRGSPYQDILAEFGKDFGPYEHLVLSMIHDTPESRPNAQEVHDFIMKELSEVELNYISVLLKKDSDCFWRRFGEYQRKKSLYLLDKVESYIEGILKGESDSMQLYFKELYRTKYQSKITKAPKVKRTELVASCLCLEYLKMSYSAFVKKVQSTLAKITLEEGAQEVEVSQLSVKLRALCLDLRHVTVMQPSALVFLAKRDKATNIALSELLFKDEPKRQESFQRLLTKLRFCSDAIKGAGLSDRHVNQAVRALRLSN